MKIFFKITCILVGLLGLNSASIAQNILFKDSNYSGSSLTLYEEDYITRLGDFGFNDSVSSLKVNTGYCILLAKDSEFRGTWFQRGVDTSALGVFNDKATSALLYYNATTSPCGDYSIPSLFKDANLENRRWPVTNSTLRPFCELSNPGCTTIASSIYIPDGMCVYLEGSNGINQYLYAGSYNLADYGLNDKVIRATLC